MAKLNIPQRLADELSLKPFQVQNALELFAEGATIPFIARYRKERTGELNEVQLRELSDRHTYLTDLEERRQVILKSIEEQGKLTDELRQNIEQTLQKNELEDLYLPFRPKRRTRATMARERGLEPLAAFVKSLNTRHAKAQSLAAEAVKYVDEAKGVKNPVDALKGASDILAEEVADTAEIRAWFRDYLLKRGVFKSQVKKDFPEGTTKYEMYREYENPVKAIAPHNLLALFRGEADGVLNVEIAFDLEDVLRYLEGRELHSKISEVREFYQAMLADSFDRLIKNSVTSEILSLKKQAADIESIRTFEVNLRNLLLASPAGMKPTLGIDPGFRTGCKVAVLGETGQFLEYQAIFPHTGVAKREDAARTLKHLIQEYSVGLIAIGNGTAGRETDAFVSEVLQDLEQKPTKVMVNESGASVYSASHVALEEFPNLDVTVRGAISIGRRLQDPLAELVKIDPKSIGVGQYQHDVDQKLLKKKLEETVESCVNYVGVDLNTASKKLLTFVSGLSSTVANNIVTYRNQNGVFGDRKQLLKVSKLGPKAFEQCAGFLRIRDGKNPLDNTAVHPESYGVVEAIAHDVGISLDRPTQIAAQLKTTNLEKYVTDTVGLPTLHDILQELEKPGRDPRDVFTYAEFKEGINDIADLEAGMELEGVVTNVANFGAFVDIGVHQDGLVHISQLADRFVSDPKDIVKVGQVVKVKVLEVNEKLKRISLSMRSGDTPTEANRRGKKPQRSKKTEMPAKKQVADHQSAPSLDALKTKFNKKL